MHLNGKQVKVLDSGFVQLVDVMGDDSAIVQAARVSYGKGTKTVREDRGLIRYLMRHQHTTPFEMVEVKFLVRVPMDCWRQWIRHRTASVNEYSTRYSIAVDAAQTTDPEEWRMQSEGNRQGSAEILTSWPDELPTERLRELAEVSADMQTPGEYLTAKESNLHRGAREVYEERLALGVAREQARKDLPLSTYTEAYWKIDLHNLFHFLALRMDPHAQHEIRQYATVIGEEFVRPLFPLAWEAFVDYRLKAVTLSRLEVNLAAAMIHGREDVVDAILNGSGLSDREIREFNDKFGLA